jgi:hypothetical protein
VPKNNLQILAVDQKLKITQNDINKLSIKCQKRTYGFWHLIESFDQVKSLKKFDQVKMKLSMN